MYRRKGSFLKVRQLVLLLKAVRLGQELCPGSATRWFIFLYLWGVNGTSYEEGENKMLLCRKRGRESLQSRLPALLRLEI